MALSGIAHRPSALKKKNKKHNTLGHRTKRQLESDNKGRVDVKSLLKSYKKELNKEERRHQAKQIRANKREQAINLKRQLGTDKTPPFLVAIIPLSININPRTVLHQLSNCDDSSECDVSQQGILHLSCSRLKQRFSFMVPPVSDLYAILDAVKGSDTVVLVWKVGEVLDDSANMLLSCLLSQGLPSTLHAVVGEEELSSKNMVSGDLDLVLKKSLVISEQPAIKAHKKIRVLKDLQSDIASKFSGPVRPYYLNKLQDVNLILRQIGSQKRKNVFYKDQRAHLIAENVSFEGEGSTGTLKMEGYIRSQPLTVNRLVHIPGWGDFQLSRIDFMSDPFPLLLNRRKRLEDHSNEEPHILELADPQLQESLDATWEEEEEDMQEEEILEGEEKGEAMDQIAKRKKRLKGAADFIDAWQMDQIDKDESVDEDDEASSLMDDACSISSKVTFDIGSQISKNPSEEELQDEEDEDDDEDNYDAKMDYDEDMEFFEKMKAANEDKEFPDEVDTPKDILSKVRFRKYRGLQSFRTSPWDLDENLPVEYKTCFNVKSFGHLKNRILKMDKEGALPGWYVRIYVKDVPRHIYNDHVKSQSPLVAFSLLPYEQKMTVCHAALMSHPSGHVRPIKSKERLIFHVGFRRFVNSPIFSEHARGDKYKYFRFFHPGQTAVATMYAPVTFPPCPISVFRERPDGAQELVATGQLLKPDLNRVVCKRVILSGHPFKINRKSAVIRLMFHFRQDIEYFKSVELRTKYGRRGHIKEPLGTKGHMKCQFDGQLKSQDTVLMCLYKRIFPKWRFDPLVPRPPPLYSFHRREISYDEEKEDSIVDDIVGTKAKKKKVQFL